LFISTDGNFWLQRKLKKDDPDDVALNAGNSYFVEAEGYRIYLLHVGDGIDVSAFGLHRFLVPEVSTIRMVFVPTFVQTASKISSSLRTQLSVGLSLFNALVTASTFRRVW
jgi:hypothetical protein